MSERDKEIIIALADNRMNINKAAEARFMHRNTVVYHIGKIKQITGLDPTDFRDLCKLLTMIGEKPSEWIPVTESLPKPYTYVLVCGEIGNATLGYRMPDREWKGVTHWMPLPEPPKENDNG